MKDTFRTIKIPGKLSRIVRLLSMVNFIQNLTKSHKRQIETVVNIHEERPELYVVNSYLSALVNESLSGPCPGNQMDVVIYDWDRWNEVCKRIVTDKTSVFYFFKDSIAKYYLSLIQGNMPKVLQSVVTNINPHHYYSLLNR